jgi:hypothetical protein
MLRGWKPKQRISNTTASAVEAVPSVLGCTLRGRLWRKAAMLFRRLWQWLQWIDRDGNMVPGAPIGSVTFDDGGMHCENARWRFEFIAAWYDFWVGVYIDREERIVYVFPLPCLGFRVYWG